MALTESRSAATLSTVFRELVEKEIGKRGWSHAELARRSGVRFSRINDWLRNTPTPGGKERGITSDNLEKVLSSLGITLVPKKSRRRR